MSRLLYFLLLGGVISCDNIPRKIVVTQDVKHILKFPGTDVAKWQHNLIEDSSTISHYSKIKNALVLSNLDNTHIETINLPFYKNGIISYLIHNLDSIFICTDSGVDIVNSGGSIIDSFYFSNPLNARGNMISLIKDFSEFPRIFYETKNKCLYVRAYSMEVGARDKLFYDIAVEAEINLASKSIELCRIKYPAKYSNFCYGELFNVHRAYNRTKHTISYTFDADESIYVYNVITKSTEVIYAKSKFQNSKIDTFDITQTNDFNLLFRHMTINNIYTDIFYDPYKNLYYRFMFSEVPEKNSKGEYNSYFDKPLILTILDENYEIVNETSLGYGISWHYYFVTPKGIFLNKQINKHPAYEKYHFVHVLVD